MKYSEIDWSFWRPTERMSLVMMVSNRRLLLIRKKTGRGKGLYSGPGGRIEDGETPMECASREVREEVCVMPTGLRSAGELMFQFADGYSLFGYVFTASGYEGGLKESEEADPVWFPLAEIPYCNMWADNRVWLPLALEGRNFTARFLFDKEEMLGCEVFRS